MRSINSIFKTFYLFSVVSLAIGTVFADKRQTVEEYLLEKINDPAYHTRSAASLLKEAEEMCQTRALSSLALTLWSGSTGEELLASGTDATIINRVAFEPRSQLLALACSDGASAPRLLITFAGASFFYDPANDSRFDFDSHLGSVLYGSGTAINALAWSQVNDARLSYIAVGTDQTAGAGVKNLYVYAWDIETTGTPGINASLINPSALSTTAPTALAWSPNRSYVNQANDPRYLAVVHGTTTLSVLKLVNGSFDSTVYTAALSGVAEDIESVHWHPNGKYIVLTFNEATDKKVKIYKFDGDALALVNPIETDSKTLNNGQATDKINAVEFSPDGQYVLVGMTHAASEGQIKVIGLNASTGTFTSTFTSQTMPTGVDDVKTVKWSPNGLFFVAGGSVSSGNEDQLKLYPFAWRFQSATIAHVTPPLGTEQFSLNDADFIKWVDWSPDGQYIVIGGDVSDGGTPSGLAASIPFAGEFDSNGTATIMNYGTEVPVRIYKVAYNEEGVAGAIGANTDFTSGLLGNEVLNPWSGSEGTNLLSAAGEPFGLDNAVTTSAMVFSPDSQYVATAFNALSGSTAPSFYVSGININDVTRNDNRGAAQYGGNGSAINALAWSRENAVGESFLAVGGTKGISGNPAPIVQVYTFKNGELNTNPASIKTPLSSITTFDNISALAWSPNANYLAVVYNTGIATTYQIAIIPFDGSEFGTPKTSQLISSATNGVRSFSWHPNGKFFVTTENIGSTAVVQVYSFDGVSFKKNAGINIVDLLTSFAPDTYRVNAAAFSANGNFVAFGTSSTTDGEAVVGILEFDGEGGLSGTATSEFVQMLSAGATGHSDIFTVAISPDSIYLTAGGKVASGGANNKLYIFVIDPLTKTLGIPTPASTEQFSNNADDAIGFNVWSPNGTYIGVGGDMRNGVTPEDITFNLDGDIIASGSKIAARIYNTGLRPGGLLNITADSTDFNSIADFGDNNLFFGTKGGSLWFRRTLSSTDLFGNDQGTPTDAWVQITGIPKGSLTTPTNFAFVLRRNLDGRLYVLDKGGRVHKTTSTSTKLRNAHLGSQFAFQNTTDPNELGLPVFTKLGQAGDSLFAITAKGEIYDYQDASKKWVLVAHPSVAANGKLCVNNNLCFNIN